MLFYNKSLNYAVFLYFLSRISFGKTGFFHAVFHLAPRKVKR